MHLFFFFLNTGGTKWVINGLSFLAVPTLTGEHSTARRLMLSAGAEHGGTPAPVPAPLPGLQPAPWESTVQLWAGKPPKTTR